jgi:hypothetical protein
MEDKDVIRTHVSVAVVLFSGDMNGWRIRRAQAKSSTAP